MAAPIPKFSNILVTGATGRIGSQVVKALISSGHTVHQIKRGAPTSNQDPLIHHVPDPTSLTMSEWKKTMQENRIKVVLNLAAQSSGDFRSMVAVNVTMPKAMAEACNNLGIRMVHTCTHSAKLKGLNPKMHPYASTKRIGAQLLENEPMVVVVRLGAVLGGKSDVPVCTDAAVSQWSPFIMLPAGGGEQILHPVDEDTVVAVMEKIVDYLTDPSKENQPLPKVIDVAGKQVPIKAFLKMVNPKAIGVLKIPEKVLNLLSKIVNKGVFTKEFTSLAKLIGANTDEMPNTTTMEDVLGVPIPSPEKVAEAARKQLSLFKTSSTITQAFFKKMPQKGPLFKPSKASWPKNFLIEAKMLRDLFFSSLKEFKKDQTSEKQK